MSTTIPADLGDALDALKLVFQVDVIPDRTDRKPRIRRDLLIERLKKYEIPVVKANKLIDYLVSTGVFEAVDPIVKEGESFESDLTIVMGLDGTDLGTEIRPIRRVAIDRAAWERFIAEASRPETRAKRNRRRKSARPTNPLTAKQAEVVHLYGELKGDFAAVGVRMGITRQTAQIHYKRAMNKLGKSAMPTPKTKSLPKDKRGNEAVVDPQS